MLLQITKKNKLNTGNYFCFDIMEFSWNNGGQKPDFT